MLLASWESGGTLQAPRPVLLPPPAVRFPGGFSGDHPILHSITRPASPSNGLKGKEITCPRSQRLTLLWVICNEAILRL